MIRPVEYTVSLDAPQTQNFQVRLLVRAVTSPTLSVALPVWRQGKYLVINPAGSVHGVTAEADTGRSLRVQKTDKTTWEIETDGASEVLIQYTVFANSLSDRTRHVDDTHAFLSGATVFMYPVDRRGDPVLVRLEAPADWQVACGLSHAPDDVRTLLAPNYDVLIDSPIEIGLHERVSFEVDGIPHEIVIWGDTRFDSDRLERDFTAVIRKESDIFGVLPYDRYVFITHVAPGLRGGTEHLNSTVMQTHPHAFEDEDRYRSFLSLAAHEMFHTWNVKRLKPAALRTIDLSRENYTDLLWFCEGTTSYYDELIVVRAGLQSPENYLKALAESIYQKRARPGFRVQSLAESSFDAWIKFNSPTPDHINTTVSYYDSGALVSLLLDLEIRKRTSNKGSLDTLMRTMFDKFPSSGPGFATQDLLKTAGEIAGSSFDDFFQSYIHGTQTYPFEDLFGVVGLEMIPRDKTPRAYSGILVQDDNGTAKVRSVLSNGPAYLAGVNVGDEIVSVNGLHMNGNEITAAIEQTMAPGEHIWLQILRRNHMRRIEFQLGEKPNSRWDLLKVSSPTEEQRATYASWLGSSF